MSFIITEEEEVGESVTDSDESVIYAISEEVRFFNIKVNSVVLIKRSLVIEADKSIASQVRVMNLNDSSPYETLHSYISAAVAPYFKSYVKETGRAERYV